MRPGDVKLEDSKDPENLVETPAITPMRVPELLPVDGEQLAADINNKEKFPYALDGLPYDFKNPTMSGEAERPDLAVGCCTKVFCLNDEKDARRYGTIKTRAVTGKVDILEEQTTITDGKFCKLVVWLEKAYITKERFITKPEKEEGAVNV